MKGRAWKNEGGKKETGMRDVEREKRMKELRKNRGESGVD